MILILNINVTCDSWLILSSALAGGKKLTGNGFIFAAGVERKRMKSLTP